MSWTPAQDSLLTEFYRQHAGRHIVVADIAKALDKYPSTVRARAHKLGLTEPNRVSVKQLDPIPCPVCGEMFKPQGVGAGRRVLTCSPSCGQKNRIATSGHNKGMLGKHHPPEARAAIGESSRRMWDRMDDDERERRAETARRNATNRKPSEATYTRSRGGRRADLDGQYFRSAWEANYARWLNYRRDVVGDIAAWKYEPQTFIFPVKRGTMSYTPDFCVTRWNGDVEWHEVKGWLTQRGATALKRFAKYYPDEWLILIDEAAYKAIARQASRLIDGWE
jgi:hypothetical protein